MKAKRLIAVVMAFLLIFGNAFSVNAVGIIGEMVTDISGLNRLTISAALNNYFNSREAFLLNQANTINIPLAGMVEDEAAHREKYVLEDIVFVDSSISIGDIVAGDTLADAEVTETVTYMKDGVTYTATVTHKLFLVPNDDNVPVVCADLYFEEFSSFRSCSYVDESRSSAMNSDEGSGSCIVYVAEGELGEDEDEKGETIYGKWFGHPDWTWCAIFVSWCANEANIATSIIPKTADPYDLKNDIAYYSRSDAVNANAPQTGDLVYFTWQGTNLDHVGIVRWADTSNVYVVHGNYSNSVCFTTFSRTDARIMGYGKPAYVNAGHTNNLTRDFNTTQHWHSCANCGYVDEASIGTHSPESDYEFNDSHHWIDCIGCAYKCTTAAHTLTYSRLPSIHQASCATCGYVDDWESHTTGSSYKSDETHHWKECSTCNQQVDREKHHFKEVLYGRVYMCIDCAYESDSPNDAGIDVEVE